MGHPIANAVCLFLLWVGFCFGFEWLVFNWPKIRAALRRDDRPYC